MTLINRTNYLPLQLTEVKLLLHQELAILVLYIKFEIYKISNLV